MQESVIYRNNYGCFKSIDHCLPEEVWPATYVPKFDCRQDTGNFNRPPEEYRRVK
jgi:hypothetical protein